MKTDQRPNLRRECENLHLEAFREIGADPQEFQFENEFRKLERRYGGMTEDQRSLFLKLKDWTPSRYEIVEFLPVYYYASQHYEKTCELSLDRRQLKRLPIAVITDFLYSLEAKARDRLFDDTYLIQIDLGLVRYCEYIARAVMAVTGSQKALLNVGQTSGKEASEALYNNLMRYRRIPFDKSGLLIWDPFVAQNEGAINFPSGSDGHLGLVVLFQALITFVIGHETGHIQCGHIGEEPIYENAPLRNRLTQEGVNQLYFKEFEADSMGLLMLFDGMPRNGVSIDFTSLSPLIYMSAMAGYNFYVREDSEVAKIWYQRFHMLLEQMIGCMYQEKFDIKRIDTLVRAIPVLSAAVTCWIGGDSCYIYQLHQELETNARRICTIYGQCGNKN